MSDLYGEFPVNTRKRNPPLGSTRKRYVGVTATVLAATAVAGAAYSANRQAAAQKKAAQAAAQPKTTTTTNTPYMDETIRAMSPYVLNEALKNYGSVNTWLGGKPADFSGLTAMLQGQSRNYGGNAASDAGIQAGIDWRKKLADQGVDLKSVFGNNLPEHGGNINLWGGRWNQSN